MREWFEGLVGPDYAVPAMIGAAVLLGLLLLFIITRLIRYMSTGTYVAGGRNRKARLAVMDAIAVDHHRRLILVRRDDVEHLVLIGGSNDVVVEQDIRMVAHLRRPTPPNEPAVAEPRHASPESAANSRAARPAPVVSPRPSAPPSNVTSLQRTQSPPVMKPAPPRALAAPVKAPAPPVSSHPVSPQPVSPPPVSPPPVSPQPQSKGLEEDFDDEILRELEVELDTSKTPKQPSTPVSLDDEMTKLLGELASNKR